MCEGNESDLGRGPISQDQEKLTLARALVKARREALCEIRTPAVTYIRDVLNRCAKSCRTTPCCSGHYGTMIGIADRMFAGRDLAGGQDEASLCVETFGAHLAGLGPNLERQARR